MSEQGDKPAKPPRTSRGKFLPGAQNPKNYAPERSGRQPGSLRPETVIKNRVKDAVLSTFETLGAERYLKKLAHSKKPAERAAFVSLLTKCIPQEVVGKDGGPIEAQILHVAVNGLDRLDDRELLVFRFLLDKMGVAEPASNDGLEPATIDGGAAALEAIAVQVAGGAAA